MVTFSDVVEGWKVAPVTAIHPLRHVSDAAYWESGRAQALHAAQWIPEGGKVLDFGCGDGRVAIPLSTLGFYVLACDASEEMLERVGQHENMERFCCDGLNGLLQLHCAEPLDAVHCRAVLIHHSHKDVEHLVNEFAKCLKSGGVLIADWPVGAHYERQNWTDVTTWESKHRTRVAEAAGFTMLDPGTDAHGSPSVWRKL